MRNDNMSLRVLIIIVGLTIAFPSDADFWGKVKQHADNAKDAIESLDEAASKAAESVGRVKPRKEEEEPRSQQMAQPVEVQKAPEPRAASVNQASPPLTTNTPPASQYDREQVLAIQMQLNALGYYEGHPDGLYGTGTRKSIESFQRDHALMVDGLPSAALQSRTSEEVRKSITLNVTPQAGNTAGSISRRDVVGSSQAGPVSAAPMASSGSVERARAEDPLRDATSFPGQTKAGVFPDCETYFMVWGKTAWEMQVTDPSYMPDHLPQHYDKYLRMAFLDENFLPFFGKPFGQFSDEEIDHFQSHYEDCYVAVYEKKQQDYSARKLSRQEWAEFSNDWGLGNQYMRGAFRFRNRNLPFNQPGQHPTNLLEQRANYQGRMAALAAHESDRAAVHAMLAGAESLSSIQAMRGKAELLYLYKSEYDQHQEFLRENEDRLARELIDNALAEIELLSDGEDGIKAALDLRRNMQRDVRHIVNAERWNAFNHGFERKYRAIASGALPQFQQRLDMLPASEASIGMASGLLDEWFADRHDYPPNIGDYKQAISQRVADITEQLRIQACERTLDSVGILDKKNRPVLGHKGPDDMSGFICNVDSSRYRLVSYRQGGFMSGTDVLTLETRRGVHIEVGLHEVEVQKGRRMMVGRFVKDPTSKKDLSIGDWQNYYAQLLGEGLSLQNF